MQVPLYDLRADYLALKEPIDRSILEVLESGSYAAGPRVAAFEQEFAAYCGARHAVGVSSGSAALELALRVCGLGVGDEVVTVPNTDTSTAAAITHCGAKVVFADVEPHSLVMDPQQLEGKITPRTKAIVPVHLFGQPATMASILDIAVARNLLVVEDAALAVGAEYRGAKVGTLGDVGCMSLNSRKILSAIGDAGIVVTNRDRLADEVRSLRNYGEETAHGERALPPRLELRHEGFNAKLDEIQAAVLRVKLAVLPEALAKRRAIARQYDEGLRRLDVTRPCASQDARHAYRAYTIRVENRDRLARHLADRGIETVAYYVPPLHLQPAYRYLGHARGDFPVAEEAAETMLSLPIHPTMSDQQVTYVVDAIVDFVRGTG